MVNSRKEFAYFTDKDDATRRTRAALTLAGFKLVENTDSIDGIPVSTYTHHGKPYRDDERKPELAGVYVDPATGNRVTFGMNITGIQRDPYNWYATSETPDGTVLDEGGNHDTTQSEIVTQLASLIGSAHFDTTASQVRTGNPEYREWHDGLLTQLDQIQYAPQSSQA